MYITVSKIQYTQYKRNIRVYSNNIAYVLTIYAHIAVIYAYIYAYIGTYIRVYYRNMPTKC